MPAYTPNLMASAQTLAHEKFGDSAQVTVSRRSQRWIATVSWEPEYHDVATHGCFGIFEDPSADSAIRNLVDWLTRQHRG